MMSQAPQLEDICEQWQQLAEAEGRAICARDWVGLAASQEALGQLQHQVSQCLERLRDQSSGAVAQNGAVPQEIRARFQRVIEIERQNAALLREVHDEAQGRLDQSQLTTRTLRRLRKSYAPAPPSAWTSFS